MALEPVSREVPGTCRWRRRTRAGARRGRRVAASVAVVFVATLVTNSLGGPGTDRGQSGVADPPSAKAPSSSRLLFSQVPYRPGDNGLSDRPARGSRIVVLDRGRSSGGVVNLTAGFWAAGRPRLSFDAERVLFIGKKTAEEALAVWEMRADGSAPRRVIGFDEDCREAVWLSTIYTIDAPHPVAQIAFCRDSEGVSVIHTCRLDGSQVRRLTYGPLGASNPLLLSDGRLLFSASVSTGGGEIRATSLMTINTDGTDLFPFAGVHGPPAWRGTPCETQDGSVVFVESAGKMLEGAGSLVAVRASRSLHSRRSLTGDTNGQYRSPSALEDGSLLVSYRRRTDESLGLYRLKPGAGNRPELIHDDPRWHDVEASAIRPRPVPAGRSSVVNEDIRTGIIYCLDSYLSDRTQRDGDRAQPIVRLRVIRALAGTDGGDGVRAAAAGRRRASGDGPVPTTAPAEVVLGEIPVRDDGSFCAEVPARVPLRLETLDSAGGVIQSMRSWFWVMPNEVRGCIGCHEDRELAPPNRFVKALRFPPEKLRLPVSEPNPAGPSAGGSRGRP